MKHKVSYCGNKFVRRYEELRSQVLGGEHTAVGGLGLSLLLCQGMAAWIEAWGKSMSVETINTSAGSNDTVNIPLQNQSAIVLQLANMAFVASKTI